MPRPKKEQEVKEVISVDEKLEQEDRYSFDPENEILTGIVYNLENPGVPIDVGFGPTKNPFKATYMHGFQYSIPRKVARFIESRKVPNYEYVPDGSGKVVKKLVGYRNRFSFKQVY